MVASQSTDSARDNLTADDYSLMEVQNGELPEFHQNPVSFTPKNAQGTHP
jgi:hypothetical protein